VASISLSTWAWRGPIPPVGRETPKAEHPKAEPAKAEHTKAGAAARPNAPPKLTPSSPEAEPPPAPPAAATVPPAHAPSAAARAAAEATDRSAAAAQATVAPVPPRPTELVRAPSLYETGRIGKAAVNEPGVPGNRGGDRAGRPEVLVDAKQPDPRVGPMPASYTGVIDQTVLDREITPRFRLLADCKAEVAHRKRVATSTITGSRLLLRWTILPSGQVTDTHVVALAPADPRLVDCVKERMSTWSFRPAQGGAARIERKFTFK
jgi:hypothetical protein